MTMQLRWACLLAASWAALAPALAPAQPHVRTTQYGDDFFLNPPTPGPLPASQLPRLTRMMLSESRRLVDEANAEAAGAPYGQQLIARCNALYPAVSSLDEYAWAPGIAPNAYELVQAAQATDSALNGVRDALQRLSYGAPSVERTVSRIGRLTFEVDRIVGIGTQPPIQPPINPGYPGYDIGALLPPAQQLASSVGQFQQLLNPSYAPAPPGDPLARSVRSLYATSEAFVAQVSGGANLGQLNGMYRRMQQDAGMIDQLNAQTGQPPQYQAVWNRARAGLGQVGAVLGGGQPFPPRPPIQPPVIPPIQPPIVPPGPPPGYFDPQAVIPPTDQVLIILDQFINALSATVTRVPNGFRILQEAQQLRQVTAQFRNDLAYGASRPQAMGAIGQVRAGYDRLARLVGVTARGHYGPNIDRVRQVGEILASVEDLIRRP